ncbi:MAG: tRNA preQ1(34) S-adenosylmethionine ribosyltransferase-isomerase QueA [Terriglobia bacterium]
MLLSDFDYVLPGELIAQRPLAERDASRLLTLNRSTQTYEDRQFRELPEILAPGDLAVFNNTRVFPARLRGFRRGAAAQAIGRNNPCAREYLSGEAELLLSRREGENVWLGLVHPGRKIRTGEILVFGAGDLEAEVLDRGEYGVRRVRLTAREGSVRQQIEKWGHVPLPPYLRRADDPEDRTAYQTVYAKVTGAVAAPTAGLHFSPQVLADLRERGIESCEITLHVGPGTFRPVRTARIENHRMDAEWYEVSPYAAGAINRALDERRRIVAVGTTCTRTLEHVALLHGGRITAGSGETNLFITPGFSFRATGALLTNFHLPRSTLLMLVSAFAGREFILRAYQHAIEQRYRFYSYGDCMLIL